MQASNSSLARQVTSVNRALFILALVLATTYAFAQNGALIVRFSRARDAVPESATSIAHFLAGELDQDGRVTPIVWSLADPMFRAASESGVIRNSKREPTGDDVKDAAQKLRAAYIITIVEEKREGVLWATLELYRTGSTNPIYKNTRNLAVSIGDRLDWENAARSHAHFWFSALTEGPFKKLKPKPKPVEDPVVDAQPTADVFPTDPKAIETANSKISSGDFSGALVVLRDAVDADPANFEKRKSLISLYEKLGYTSLLASEARRASLIFPDQVELRLIAVRSWMQLDRLEDATADLNAFLSRKANDAQALCLLGDLLIAKQEPELAIEPYTKSLEIVPCYGARFGRALAYALIGKSEECTKDLVALGKVSDSEIAASYPVAVQNLERAVETLGAKLRQVLQQARVSSGNAENIQAATDCMRLAESLASLTSKILVPSKHQQSHLRRDLAQKLLVQASGEALAFAKSGEEDTGSDAAISLGDALKQLSEIRKQYESEIGN